MPAVPRRPVFYLAVLGSGFVLGGFLAAFLRRFLPDSPTRDFFTFAVRPSIGPVPVDLIVLDFAVGPVGLEVTLLSLVGVGLAYLVARSLF